MVFSLKIQWTDFKRVLLFDRRRITVTSEELQDYRMFFLSLTDPYRYFIPDETIKKLVEEKALKLIIEVEKLQQALIDIVNIPPCECGDRKQGFDCMCGTYNAHEIAENALKGVKK
jgi:hypothetical protein